MDKLFLPHEQQLIKNAPQQPVMVWLLWSCKEAVYKIVHRATRVRKFAPQEFACYPFNDNDTDLPGAGIVVHQQQSYYFQTRITNTCIHTHAAASQALLQKMRIFTGYYTDRNTGILSPAQLLYKDESGVPYIRDRDTGFVTPVSLSHHGRYFGLVNIS